MQQKQQVIQRLDRLSTEATLIYLISTNPASHRSIILKPSQQFSDLLGEDIVIDKLDDDGELSLAGEIYKGLGETNFSLQDESGLVNVNSPNVPLLRKTLVRSGINVIDSGRLLARLKDYIDADHKLSLNGAELFEYQQRQLPPPANGLLATPLELKKVLGFDDLVTKAQWQALLPLLSARQAVGYNVNVMPPEVISALLEIDFAETQKLIEFRQEKRISSTRQIEEAIGELVELDDDSLLNTPSRFIRISLWNEGSGQRHITGVEFTPFVKLSPWRIDYQYTETINKRGNAGGAERPQSVSVSLLH